MIDFRTAPYAALLLRVTLGTMFVAHALLKLQRWLGVSGVSDAGRGGTGPSGRWRPGAASIGPPSDDAPAGRVTFSAVVRGVPPTPAPAGASLGPD